MIESTATMCLPVFGDIGAHRAFESDLADEDENNRLVVQSDMESGRNYGISCELGIRYPTLQSIMSGSNNLLSIQVVQWCIACSIACYIRCVCSGRVRVQ